MKYIAPKVVSVIPASTAVLSTMLKNDATRIDSSTHVAPGTNPAYEADE